MTRKLIGWIKIAFPCGFPGCKKRADYELTVFDRTNATTRLERYCEKHVPTEFRETVFSKENF